MNCKDCGQSLKTDLQERFTAGPIEIVTCFNRSCTLWSVTLSADVYAAITDEKLESYREMVANLKKQFEH